MYPQAQVRVSQRSANNYTNLKKTKEVVTADFKIPISPCGIAEDNNSDTQKVFPRNVNWHTGSQLNSSISENLRKIALQADMFIGIGVGENNWTFHADFRWLRGLNTKKTSLPFTLIKGTIQFRSKYFGSWEPFEYMKHFVVENAVDNSAERLVEYIFTTKQFEKTLASYKQKEAFNFRGKFTLEMTFIVERISFSKEEDSLLRAQAIRMSNALISIPAMSDFRVKVENEEYFVHLKQIKAFSCEWEALTKYFMNIDWSHLLSPESMQALLRFMYYCEVDMICNHEVAFELLQFGHAYKVPALFKVCRGKLLSYSEDKYTLADLFEIYMFARIPDEFQQLKRHFCRILSKNAAKYDTMELKHLAKRPKDLSGIDALVEFLQFVAEEEPEEPSAHKRPRT